MSPHPQITDDRLVQAAVDLIRLLAGSDRAAECAIAGDPAAPIILALELGKEATAKTGWEGLSAEQRDSARHFLSSFIWSLPSEVRAEIFKSGEGGAK